MSYIKVNSCCLCLPLRCGLLIWGYFAAIITYMACLFTLYQLHELFYASGKIDSNQFVYKTFALVGILVYFIFNVVLVAGLHKDSKGLLIVYKGYITISLVFEGIVAALYIPLALYRIYHDNVHIIVIYNESDILNTMLLTFFFYAMLVVAVVLISKVYVLLCVRSMISTMDEEKDAEQPPAYCDVIQQNNFNVRAIYYDSDS